MILLWVAEMRRPEVVLRLSQFALLVVDLLDRLVTDYVALDGLVSGDLVLNLVLHFLLDLDLVLDEGYAEDFDDNGEVAERLCEPKALGVRHVLVEHATYESQLGSKRDEHLGLVEMLLDVSVKEALVFREDCVEEVYHEEKHLERHILPVLFLHYVARLVQVLRLLVIVLELEGEDLEGVVEDLTVVDEKLDGVVLDQLAQLEQHPVRVFQVQLVWLHADDEVYHADDTESVRNELSFDAELIILANVEHECLQLRLVAVLVRSLDHLNELPLVVDHELRLVLLVVDHVRVLLVVQSHDADVLGFEEELAWVLAPLLNGTHFRAEHVADILLSASSDLDENDQVVVAVVADLLYDGQLEILSVPEVGP